MGFLNGMLGGKNNVNWNKAFEKSPDDVFQGDPRGEIVSLKLILKILLRPIET
jgi:hypothetical protein